MASHEPAPQVHNGVSTLDVPSAAWGYSAVKRTTIQVTGWLSVLWLLGLNFGNHEGHVETIYLFTFAILIALGLLIHLFEPKLSGTHPDRPQQGRKPQRTRMGLPAGYPHRRLR